MGFYGRTLQDYDGENTQFRVNVADLNAGNFAAELVLQAALGAAINDMVTGTLQTIRYGNETLANYAAPTDPFSQRELKWLVRYHDATTGKNFRVELGTADLANLDPNNRDRAYIGDGGVVDAFVDAFEAYVLAPETGNAVVIDSIVPVGRNI